MKVIVCGGRRFRDKASLCRHLDNLHQEHGFTTVIEGGARGADWLARFWAKRRNIEHICVPADWDNLSKKAGPIRNAEMLDLGPDLVVAFPGNAGTSNMIIQARRRGVPVIEPMSNHEPFCDKNCH